MKRLGIAALLTVACGLVMGAVLRGPARYPFETNFRQIVSSPILAIELANGTEADVNQVLCGSPRVPCSDTRKKPQAARAIRINTYLDLAFIVLYVWYLIEFARAAAADRIALTITVIAILAGIFDYVEDGFIFASLSGTILPTIAPSLAKWALLAVVLLLVSACLLRSTGRLYSLATDRLFGIVHLCAGILIGLGVIAGRWRGYSWIQTGAAMFACSILVNALYPVIVFFRGKFHGRTIIYVADFCSRRARGEKPGRAVIAKQ